jgi:L-cysteine:1D-myo-inositol 2-amino-2-deoxy-alpha-D-glucopyranoside ligase
LNRIGAEFDVQGGGSDLIFPHHEFSAAHAEALTGVRRFAKHYVHTGMIGLDGEKMSKSRGNLVFVSELRAAQVDPAAIRLGLLAGHYRTDRAWTDDVLAEATSRLDGWRRAVQRGAGPDAAPTIERLRQHLADDLDTPKALAAIDAWAADSLDGLGSVASAPADLGLAVDALLGVPLTDTGAEGSPIVLTDSGSR